MLLYNISSAISSLTEKIANVRLFGVNTVNGKTEYMSPCSQGPWAKLYVMTVYALSAEPVLGIAQKSNQRYFIGCDKQNNFRNCGNECELYSSLSFLCLENKIKPTCCELSLLNLF